MSDILFRDTNDAGSRSGEQVKVSHKWYAWHINDKDFATVGKVQGEKCHQAVIQIKPNTATGK